MTEGHIRPQMKHTSPVYFFDDVLYIDGYGQTTEIADPRGTVRDLLSLLDGTRSVTEVHEDLVRRHPEVTLRDVEAAVDQFDTAGFLLNAAETADGLLDEYELSRWHRNINFFGSFAHLSDNKYLQQVKLRDCRVTLLGLGGLGTHLLMDMAALGIGHMRVVEFDRVELSNLNRQILYREADVGQQKIELAVDRVRQFSPRLDIEAMPRRLSSTADVIEAAEGADVLICVADRPKMEIIRWVNEAITTLGIPMISGGLETKRCLCYTVIPGRTGCVECWRRKVSRDDRISDTLLDRKRELQIGGDNAAFVPLVTMTTALMLGELVRVVTGIAPPVAAGRLLQVHFSDYQMSEAERWDPDPDCPMCSHCFSPTTADVRSAVPVAPAV